MTVDEQRAVVRILKQLEGEIAGGTDPTLTVEELQRAYYGPSRALVDGFLASTDHVKSIQQLSRSLLDEIEPGLWTSPSQICSECDAEIEDQDVVWYNPLAASGRSGPQSIEIVGRASRTQFFNALPFHAKCFEFRTGERPPEPQ